MGGKTEKFIWSIFYYFNITFLATTEIYFQHVSLVSYYTIHILAIHFYKLYIKFGKCVILVHVSRTHKRRQRKDFHHIIHLAILSLHIHTIGLGLFIKVAEATRGILCHHNTIAQFLQFVSFSYPYG